MRNMKDSGIEWIGKIPEDWEIMKMRYLGNFSSSGIDKKINPEEPLVKIINYTDVYGNLKMLLNNKDYMTVSAPQDKINKNLVEEGDLIFTPSSETIEDIGVSALINEKLENTSFSYHVLRFQFYKNINKQYKKYLCNNNYVQNYFSSRAVGSIRKTLNRDDFKELNVLIPPLEEQELIANYLDNKVKEIDNIISKTQETIEEYKKYKQSVITEAVTKGLNPNVEMKDSGIEWIGEIPKHWQICKIKNILVSGKDGIKIGPFGSALKGRTLRQGDYKIYNQANLINNDFDLDRHFVSEETFKELSNYIISPGDILLSMMGTIGKCRIMPANKMPGIMDSHLLKVRLNNNILQRYFEYLYDKDNSLVVISQLLFNSKGTIMNGLNSEIVKNILITYPISLEEQQDIINYLDRKCYEIDNLITKKEELITQLELYKKSLIYEYVTGKKEVEVAYGY